MGNCTNMTKDTLVAATELIRAVGALKVGPEQLALPDLASQAVPIEQVSPAMSAIATPAMLEFTIIDPRIIQQQLSAA